MADLLGVIRFFKVILVTKMITSNQKMVTSNLYHHYFKKILPAAHISFPFSSILPSCNGFSNIWRNFFYLQRTYNLIQLLLVICSVTLNIKLPQYRIRSFATVTVAKYVVLSFNKFWTFVTKSLVLARSTTA